MIVISPWMTAFDHVFWHSDCTPVIYHRMDFQTGRYFRDW